MPIVLDYSSWRPSMEQLHGMTDLQGVSRYLTYPDSTFNKAKQITKPEYDQLIANGFTVNLNWEWQKGTWREGFAGGRRDGAEARRQADALGYPGDCIVVQSVDTDALPSEYPTAFAYQDGFNQGYVRGPQGMYGEGTLIDQMFDRGLIRIGWNTMATAWGGVSGRAQMVQTQGLGAYDINVVRTPWWGAANTCIFGYRCMFH